MRRAGLCAVLVLCACGDALTGPQTTFDRGHVYAVTVRIERNYQCGSASGFNQPPDPQICGTDTVPVLVEVDSIMAEITPDTVVARTDEALGSVILFGPATSTGRACQVAGPNAGTCDGGSGSATGTIFLDILFCPEINRLGTLVGSFDTSVICAGRAGDTLRFVTIDVGGRSLNEPWQFLVRGYEEPVGVVGGLSEGSARGDRMQATTDWSARRQ